MRDEKRAARGEEPGGREPRPVPRRRRYEPPRIVDYGRVSKLTQTGGATTKDNGNMARLCL
jgi:hypothetical protein